MEHPAVASDDALRPLLLAATGGCPASFAQLYERTHRRIFGIVLRIVRHRAEAEEVLQDVYVKVWSRGGQFDPHRGLVISWLAGIAQRAAIDCRRRASSRPCEVNDSLDDTDAYSGLASAEPGPADAFEQSQTQRLLREQLQALPPDQHESLALAFLDGLTHSEIAAKLACPLGTIKSRVRRALTSLRPQLYALQ
jgi:RNA polymerase sigma-70 factor (ECF subfamily)